MAHLGSTYTSFEAFLGRADAFWTVDLTALNSSGVQSTAVLAMSTEDDGTPYLNVSIVGEGMTANIGHAQHIHGTFDGQGNPTDATTPTLADDADGDGIVEVLEGVGKYGDVLLGLTDADGNFVETDANGQLSFIQSYDLSDNSQFVSPVTNANYTAEDLMPLALREIVLHGMVVPDGLGAGTGGEVDGGTNGYTGILPVAAGEIETATYEEALQLLAQQRDVASDIFSLDANDNRAKGGTGDDTMLGKDGNDTLDGGADDDVIRGGADNDKLIGRAGSDVLDGGTGNDTLDSGVDDDNQANAADMGASGALTLSDYDNGLAGGAGDDLIVGRAGDDIITGDDDSRITAVTNRAFDASADGSDVIYGGAGNDEIHTGSWSDSDQGLPNAQTGMANDTAFGGDGHDILRGAGGDDLLRGDAGDDNIGGGGGNDTMVGGEGSDTFLVSDLGDMIFESRSWSGTDTVMSSVDFAMGRQHIENLTLTGTDDLTAIGNGLANVITGNSGNNILDGGTNVDTLVGGDGDDIYRVRTPGDTIVEDSGGGTDTVFAFKTHLLESNVENLALQTTVGLNGIGNDIDNMITGNMADNVLIGRGGNDWLRGQGGDDTFVFDRQLNAETNVDTIADFESGSDMILLRSNIFSDLETTSGGTLAAESFVMGQIAADADDRIIFDSNLGNVYYDADGSGSADQVLFARIGNDAMLTSDDFQIV